MWAKISNNIVGVEEEEEVVEEVEAPGPHLLDLVINLNHKLGCMQLQGKKRLPPHKLLLVRFLFVVSMHEY